ncbi:type I methionyl aminopeptidase [Streptomyces sp. NPDC048496]|uniref:type I methionyl aminopeptidase n=1 Tax=Streptomyces sp. NPDC048496 TaxID=3365558 RepID=UPI0037197D06
MVEIKTDAALDAMREAGRVVARALAAAQEAAGVGVSLQELDEAARSVLAEAGADSPFLGYRPSFAPVPFPAVICTSVNDAVSHGIPTGYRLRDGDLVSIDCGAQLDGWTGDAAITFTVGTPRPGDLELIEATQQALDAGIAAAQVGSRIGDISHAVDTVARKAACGMPADFGGHGIGRRMHEDPHVRVTRNGAMLSAEITDDGTGGADASRGSGLDGIRRRAAALDGTMKISSPPGGPTTLTMELPCV